MSDNYTPSDTTGAIQKGINNKLSYDDNTRVNVSVVVPVYNSAITLSEFCNRTIETLKKFGGPFEIVFVNDGSRDDSWKVLLSLKETYPTFVRIVNLVRNSGQHNAILCGFSVAQGEIVVTIDDDLQNPPEEIPRLLAPITEGYDLVIGAYSNKKHTKARNFFGGLIDFVQRKLFKLPANFQLTSFRSIKKEVVSRALNMKGAYPYITSMLLFNSSTLCNVEVVHAERSVGMSNYNLSKSISLALNLLLSYSPYPLYLVISACLFSFLFSFGFGLYTLIRALVYGVSVQGWASLVVLVSFFSALILMSLVVFGLYVARIHNQISGTRPSYSIKEQI